ncbi:3-hydroxyacyl-CoA dehydrogenase NAD-binding domain-containing protein [Pseudomonas asiatica]|uniref:3-hydroxyacyl-CoA dehydrogenase NAD-binding domain-containing protein n=1 Tax=Pseudomonas asiatica TaxID=2219225 RepID=UPI002E7BAF13|nr:3-hydroxyacyl-CoA dehydrogenase NAD-binding domain-containing protein [Pseudomonas asiatica]MEE1920016.1 3-hydroxyacyl-CoA dehydrogenase NAD-binding domain-containing protein [Pseudomonas asiatica]
MNSFNSGFDVSVVGTGTMGKGIVQILAQSAYVSSITWKGKNIKSVQKALGDLEVQWGRAVSKKRLTGEEAASFARKISITHEYSDLLDKQCVIEAVSEKMSVKKEIFSEIDRVVGKETILASNTSSLSVTELASQVSNPTNLIGLHFFNPAPVMKLTEVVVGLTTSENTLNWVLDFSRKLGKDPVIVNEAPGFIVNRMLIPMINEAIAILAEGVASANEIDKAMRLGANHPIGPLALADLIGNDVCLSIMETLHSETGDPKYRAHPLLRKTVRANRLGRKTAHGFFQY